jgi:hypothetical protein
MNEDQFVAILVGIIALITFWGLIIIREIRKGNERKDRP